MSQTPDLKGTSFPLTVLHMYEHSTASAICYLDEKVAKAPAFFKSAPLVINLSQASSELDLVQLKQGIINIGMVPVGVTECADKHLEKCAREAGLAVMTGTNRPDKAPVEITPSKIIRNPVRSGQQIYAKDSDLIILNHVSAGAEVIADGNIHIYGTLRGRALAGASGQDASIICHNMQAELVSIAGNYWLSEQIESHYWGEQVILSLTDQTLHCDFLNIK
ncbi:septum site-determining protein MinC [Vibrio ezurae]|uniref:Probable septum site-determining protein MinC n=1 Tax=Vibrio ezurae NBRC 102218 TaxID=1219080 RepID=U3CJJ3_9VIBR|nr:septum site-determining protein MinC [Vibrio ezurae]GAD81304.1 putative septum site-determining protein MinC [Vibrio ezurae NBRC 102218]